MNKDNKDLNEMLENVFGAAEQGKISTEDLNGK